MASLKFIASTRVLSCGKLFASAVVALAIGGSYDHLATRSANNAPTSTAGSTVAYIHEWHSTKLAYIHEWHITRVADASPDYIHEWNASAVAMADPGDPNISPDYIHEWPSAVA